MLLTYNNNFDNSQQPTANTTPILSVITPTFNRADMLLKAAESVLNQSLKHLEYIIVDDCSTDNTQDVVHNLIKSDSRVKYLKNDINSGQGISRRNGFRVARGKYAVFIDDDDFYTDMDFFEKAINLFESNPEKNFAFVAANTKNYNMNTMTFTNHYIGCEGFVSGLDYMLSTTKPNSTFPTVFKSDVLKKSGLNTLAIFDTAVYYQAALLGNAYIFKDIIGTYTIHKNSVSVGYTQHQQYYDRKRSDQIEFIKILDIIKCELQKQTNTTIANWWYLNNVLIFVNWCSKSSKSFLEQLGLMKDAVKVSSVPLKLCIKFITEPLKNNLRKITPLLKIYRMLRGRK